MIILEGSHPLYLHAVSILWLFSWCLDKSFCLKLLFQLTGSNCLFRRHREQAGVVALLLWHCMSVCLSSVSQLPFRNCLHPSQGQNYPGQGFCFRSSLGKHSYSLRPQEQGAGGRGVWAGPYMETAEHFRGGSGVELALYHSRFPAFSLLHLGP